MVFKSLLEGMGAVEECDLFRDHADQFAQN